MADDAFASDAAANANGSYGTIVVVGGGCYGSYYVRQLGRANRAGAITWERVLVVDKNPACMVASNGGLSEPGLISANPILVVAEWTPFFREYLSGWAASTERRLTDAIVPSPLMPHLLYEWVRDRARERWPRREVETRPLGETAGTPWEAEARDGTRYVSFATWMCPINCIEPEVCPHTKGERTWTMPVAMQEFVDKSFPGNQKIEGPLVFQCTHRAYGVGMIPVEAVVRADEFIETIAATRPATVLVATVSHCHGAMNVLSVR
jgi:hypothetical protein